MFKWVFIILFCFYFIEEEKVFGIRADLSGDCVVGCTPGSARMGFDFGRGGRVCDDKISEGVELCPFLRNIGVTTSFAFSNLKFPVPAPVSLRPNPFPLLSFIYREAPCKSV